MQNRSSIVADYLQLRLILNRANVYQNEQSEIRLQINRSSYGEYILSAVLLNTARPKHIELCRRGRSLRSWEPSCYSGLIHLEQYCADFLRKNLPDTPSSLQLENVAKDLMKDLSSLGISME